MKKAYLIPQKRGEKRFAHCLPLDRFWITKSGESGPILSLINKLQFDLNCGFYMTLTRGSARLPRNMFFPLRFIVALYVLCRVSANGFGQVADPAESAPDYNFEVRPILAAHCFRCHGQDSKSREEDLRLDVRAEAIKSGALTPGHPEKSEMWARILSDDPEEVMPPPKEKKTLTEAQKRTLESWIKAGAPYAEHWSFTPPQRPQLPVADAGTSPIDAWIQERLKRAGAVPAPEATREEWLRRATVDLTGLPPTLNEIDAFLADGTPQAHEKVVDRLLQSTAYGERMANEWMDISRYADTYGRHEDADCITWPYRDWLIRAFNQNLPYDQFVLWQTAGDMLPNPTRDQMIATCFNRLPQQSNEAGSNAEEFRIEQVADRLRTNGLAFLGLSVECARCHDHKYDPISTREYYQLAAMLNNIDELGLFCVYTGGVPPPSVLLLPEDKDTQFNDAKAEIARLEKLLEDSMPAAKKRFEEWLNKELPPMQPEALAASKNGQLPVAAPTKPLAHFAFESLDEKKLVNSADAKRGADVRLNSKLFIGRKGAAIEFKRDNAIMVHGVPESHRSDAFSFGLWINPGETTKRSVLAHRSRSGIDSASRGFEIILVNDVPEFALVHFSPGNEIRIRARKSMPLNQWTHLAATYDGSSRADGMRFYINGKRADVDVVRDNLYRDIVYRADWGDDVGAKDGVSEFGLVVGGRHNDASYKNGLVDEFFFFDQELSPPEVSQWALVQDRSQASDWLEWYLRERDEPTRAIRAQLHTARTLENNLSGEAVDLMVMKEMKGPRRPTHILDRGQFDKPKDEVQPGVLDQIFPFPADLPRDRLGYARWLVHPKHPLTSRVAVNRLWQMFFGRGLVLTSEDFGTQGQLPSHPELLDWLAVTFIENGWDVKRFCREIVLSATYRQSSRPADAKWLEDDPENRLLARGPRQRLSAEQIRDLALFTSGLLSPEIGGKSVKPYQPAGLWEESGTQHAYEQDHGDKLYRRSMYTFWRRTMPPPSMTVFDAPTREFCKVRRERTSTPMQSLVLMNDPQLIEAGRVLAERLVEKHPTNDGERVRDACRMLTSRSPEPEQCKLLETYLAQERQEFARQPQLQKDLLTGNGEKPLLPGLPEAEVAATTMMVHLLMGFSETTVKP